MLMDKQIISEYLNGMFHDRMKRVLESQLSFSIQVIQNNDVQNIQTMKSIQYNTKKTLENVKRV